MILKDYFIGLVLVAAVGLGFTSVWTGMFDRPENNIQSFSSEMNRSIMRFNETMDSMVVYSYQMQGNVTGLAAVWKTITSFIPYGSDISNAIMASLNTFSIALELPGMFIGMITSVSIMLGFGENAAYAWVSTAFITIVIFSILFSIYELLTRGKV